MQIIYMRPDTTSFIQIMDQQENFPFTNRPSHNQSDLAGVNKLRDLNVNDMNIGEQYDNQSVQERSMRQNFEEPLRSKGQFAKFEFPLVSWPLKQIQSTYISQVACGLEHTLLLTSSGFVYSMGRNDFGQLGGEQQHAPEVSLQGDYDLNQPPPGDNYVITAPQMIFALLNTKVTDIQCGSNHNVVVGTLRSNTAAMSVGNMSAPGQGYKRDHGYSAYQQASLSK